MWYFSWVLGLGLACCLAILNAMWYELQNDNSFIEKEEKIIKKDKETIKKEKVAIKKMRNDVKISSASR